MEFLEVFLGTCNVMRPESPCYESDSPLELLSFHLAGHVKGFRHIFNPTGDASLSCRHIHTGSRNTAYGSPCYKAAFDRLTVQSCSLLLYLRWQATVIFDELHRLT